MTSEPESIRVFLVEDHALTRAGLRTAFAEAGFCIVGESGDGLAAQQQILSLQPHVAVLDVGLPGQDGIALSRALKTACPQMGIVIVTMQEGEDYVFPALTAGANAFCVKTSNIATVIDAVRTVAAGGAYFDPKIAHLILNRLNNSNTPRASQILTPRELDILRLVAEGHGNLAIADMLYLGVGTVKGHIHDILEKLSASDRAQAAVIAFRQGWLR